MILAHNVNTNPSGHRVSRNLPRDLYKKYVSSYYKTVENLGLVFHRDPKFHRDPSHKLDVGFE